MTAPILPRIAGGAFATLALLGPAMGADYLRGTIAEPAPVAQEAGIDWAGVYFGGHAGYTSASLDLGNLNTALGAAGFGNPPLSNLGNKTADHGLYGGFAGFNMLWDDVVLGVEVDYSRANLTWNRSGTGGTISETVRTKLNDFGLVKLRAGWTLGRFLPFATVGLALGNIDTDAVQYPIGFPNTARARYSSSGVSYGFAVGLGADVAISSNLFLRGEWQYAHFSSARSADLSFNTARLGVGVKF